MNKTIKKIREDIDRYKKNIEDNENILIKQKLKLKYSFPQNIILDQNTGSILTAFHQTPPINLPELEKKVNAIINYLNLEYKTIKEHSILIKKENKNKNGNQNEI